MCVCVCVCDFLFLSACSHYLICLLSYSLDVTCLPPCRSQLDTVLNIMRTLLCHNTTTHQVINYYSGITSQLAIYLITSCSILFCSTNVHTWAYVYTYIDKHTPTHSPIHTHRLCSYTPGVYSLADSERVDLGG